VLPLTSVLLADQSKVLGVEVGEQAPPGDAPKRRVVKKAPPKAAVQPGGLTGSAPIRLEPDVR
jgi:hypothetical protein